MMKQWHDINDDFSNPFPELIHFFLSSLEGKFSAFVIMDNYISCGSVSCYSTYFWIIYVCIFEFHKAGFQNHTVPLFQICPVSEIFLMYILLCNLPCGLRSNLRSIIKGNLHEDKSCVWDTIKWMDWEDFVLWFFT